MSSASTCCSPARKKRSRCRPGLRSSPSSEKAFARAAKVKGPRLLFRLPRVQEEPGRGHDARARRASRTSTRCNRSSTTSSPKAWTTATRATRSTNELVHDWVRAQRLRFLRAGRLPLEVAHLRGKQSRHRRRRPDREAARRSTSFIIDGGYGKLKGKTFRLSNMGDETEETVSHLLGCLDDCLA